MSLPSAVATTSRGSVLPWFCVDTVLGAFMPRKLTRPCGGVNMSFYFDGRSNTPNPAPASHDHVEPVQQDGRTEPYAQGCEQDKRQYRPFGLSGVRRPISMQPCCAEVIDCPLSRCFCSHSHVAPPNMNFGADRLMSQVESRVNLS